MVEEADSDKHSTLLITRLHSIGRLLAMLANIRLRSEWVTVTNTLAYFDTLLITALPSKDRLLALPPNIRLEWK
jgi:hypothetical protein